MTVRRMRPLIRLYSLPSNLNVAYCFSLGILMVLNTGGDDCIIALGTKILKGLANLDL